MIGKAKCPSALPCDTFYIYNRLGVIHKWVMTSPLFWYFWPPIPPLSPKVCCYFLYYYFFWNVLSVKHVFVFERQITATMTLPVCTFWSQSLIWSNHIWNKNSLLWGFMYYCRNWSICICLFFSLLTLFSPFLSVWLQPKRQAFLWKYFEITLKTLAQLLATAKSLC